MIEIVPSLLFVRRVLLLSLTSEETATESILRPSAQDDTLPRLVVAPFKTSRQEIGSSNSATLLKRRKFVLAISTPPPEPWRKRTPPPIPIAPRPARATKPRNKS